MLRVQRHPPRKRIPSTKNRAPDRSPVGRERTWLLLRSRSYRRQRLAASRDRRRAQPGRNQDPVAGLALYPTRRPRLMLWPRDLASASRNQPRAMMRAPAGRERCALTRERRNQRRLTYPLRPYRSPTGRSCRLLAWKQDRGEGWERRVACRWNPPWCVAAPSMARRNWKIRTRFFWTS